MLALDKHRIVEIDEIDVPLDLSDILAICQEYSLLGFQLQNCLTNILDNGVEETVNSGKLNLSHIPFLIGFLDILSKNPYFGDAAYQAKQVKVLLQKFVERKQAPLLN
jgi:hypothetical protein